MAFSKRTLKTKTSLVSKVSIFLTCVHFASGLIPDSPLSARGNDDNPLISDNKNNHINVTFRTKSQQTKILKFQSATSDVISSSVEDATPYRLPKDVIPLKYFLTITPILEPGYESIPGLGEQWTAPGSVSISLQVIRPVRSIKLHSKNITVHNVTLLQNGTDSIPIELVSHVPRHSFMILYLGNLISGHYVLHINFTSYISEDLNGLFRSSYKNDNDGGGGSKEWFAATHMEALHARQMFPCFDEPGFKAVIEAKIGRLENYVALFNTESTGNETMNIPGQQGSTGNWVWETFAPTVKMSTYLTALVIAKFRFTEAPGHLLPETRVRTYAPAHFISQGAANYSAALAEKILHTYGTYFEEKYPMSKFDSVAVPSFLYGAMENFGLSIFRETLLLRFDNLTTEAERYMVANVVCHELGHQWFGNLVSPDWWTHLWLSEGLTKFTEYIGLNATVPEFHPWDIFISESLQLGLRLDADSRTSHSLKIDEDAWSMKSEMEWFDDIAYKKGGSLIKMMQGFLTEPVLRKGLSRYLDRKKYQSAVQEDLFADLDIEARLADKLPGGNVTLNEIMSTWTLTSGFPLLRVRHSPGTSKIRVTQEKYSSDPNRDTTRPTRQGQSANQGPKWFIPVSLATLRNPSFDPQPEFWMRSDEPAVVLSVPADSWVILNAGTTGFYRVIYDEELSSRINAQLLEYPGKIDKLARSQLIDDYFNAAWNRYIPVPQALNFTRYMRDHPELEHVVWTSFLTMMKVPFKLFKDNPEDLEIFRAYMLPRLERAIEGTGGFGAVNMTSRGIDVIRQAQLLDWACSLDSAGCRDHAVKMVQSWKSSGVLEIPRDLRIVLLATAVAADADNHIFEFLMEQYTLIGDGNDDPVLIKLKKEILTSLANTRSPEKIKQLLELIFERERITTTNNQKNESSESQQLSVYQKLGSDAITVLQHLAQNGAASEQILQYFVANFKQIVERFGSPAPITATANAMASHLKSLTGLFLIENLVQSDEKLFKTAFSPVINRIRANIIWYDDFGEAMLDFFEHHK